jgi:hypothetical protein
MTMATTIRWPAGLRDQPHREKPMPPDPSCQPCPDCGGLECLCRPRFFAGQLLTEQDLNRLDHYIVEKHKLHNRHLWGWGVVCGLEVRCAPCDELVTVSSGYALSPCGEDIVVCKPDTVDICSLIARCRTDSEPDCRPYAGQDSCGDVIEEWILAVRYAESPSRGVTALTGAGQGCGCSCGGGCSAKPAGSCGCGCATCSPGAAKGVLEPATLKTPRLNRGAPPSCEPTLTCETYRYDVFRAPEPDDDEREGAGLAGLFGSLEGDLFAKVRCCLQQLQKALPAMPGALGPAIPPNQHQAWFKWCCQMRTALARYLATIGGHDCEAIEKLQAVVCPDPAQPPAAFDAALKDAMQVYGLIVFEAIIGCICSAALPPCPPAGDPRVPLAVVKVRRSDCHIVSVCNWTPLRKHVVTFPTLRHWFGWIPIARIIREFMHALCCEHFGLREQFDRGDIAQPQPVAGGRRARPSAAAPTPAPDPLKAPISVDPLAALKLDTALFEAIGLSVGAAQTPTWGDVVGTALARDRLTIDPALTGEDRDAELKRVADSAPLRLLGGVFGDIAPLIRSEPDHSTVARDLAALRETVEKQSAEIKDLKARISRK